MKGMYLDGDFRQGQDLRLLPDHERDILWVLHNACQQLNLGLDVQLLVRLQLQYLIIVRFKAFCLRNSHAAVLDTLVRYTTAMCCAYSWDDAQEPLAQKESLSIQQYCADVPILLHAGCGGHMVHRILQC